MVVERLQQREDSKIRIDRRSGGRLFEYGFKIPRSIEDRTVISVPLSKGGTLTAEEVAGIRASVLRLGVPREIIIVPLPGVCVGKYLSDLLVGLPRPLQREIYELAKDFLQEEQDSDLYDLRFLGKAAREVGCSWNEFAHLMTKVGEEAGVRQKVVEVLKRVEYHSQKRIAGISDLASGFALWDVLLVEHGLLEATGKPVRVQTAFVRDYKREHNPGFNLGPENVLKTIVHPQLIRRLAKNISGTVAQRDIEKTIKAGAAVLSRALQSNDFEPIRKKFGVEASNLEGFEINLEEIDVSNGDLAVQTGERILLDLIEFWAESARVAYTLANEARIKQIKAARVNGEELPLSGKDMLMRILRFAIEEDAVVLMQRLPKGTRGEIRDKARRLGIDLRRIEAVMEEPKDQLPPCHNSSVFKLWL